MVLEMCEKVLIQLKQKRKLMLPPGHGGGSNHGGNNDGGDSSEGGTGGFGIGAGIGFTEVTPSAFDGSAALDDRAHHASALASLANNASAASPPLPLPLPLPSLPPSSSSSLSSVAALPPAKRTKRLDPTALDESELIALEALLCNAKGSHGNPTPVPTFPPELLAAELLRVAAETSHLPAPAASDYGDTSGADSTDDGHDDGFDALHRYGFQHARVGAIVLAIPVVAGSVYTGTPPLVDPMFLANMELHRSRQRPL